MPGHYYQTVLRNPSHSFLPPYSPSVVNNFVPKICEINIKLMLHFSNCTDLCQSVAMVNLQRMGTRCISASLTKKAMHAHLLLVTIRCLGLGQFRKDAASHYTWVIQNHSQGRLHRVVGEIPEWEIPGGKSQEIPFEK